MTDGFNKEKADKLKKFGTCTVSDAMDRLGIPCGLNGIKPIVKNKAICGPAFTVHYIPCGLKKGTVGDFLDDVQPGEVVVIDNAGRDYGTVWGGLMSLSSSLRGIEGTIIDGVCRDLEVIYEQSYPIFTKGFYMVTGKDRVEVDQVGGIVSISGIQVKAGDIILGDDTGVLVIPRERFDEVYATSLEIFEKESLMEENIRKGMSLREARAQVSYHNLQTRRS
ncbi:MAG: RraA family protein [Treponema sp.]|nr:RraA family protein [Treponema sp.]